MTKGRAKIDVDVASERLEKEKRLPQKLVRNERSTQVKSLILTDCPCDREMEGFWSTGVQGFE
jgi:hypothetical protein